jgi:hypothetical protein
MTYNLDTTFSYDTAVSGGGSSVAHDATLRAATLTIGTGATDSAVLQSHYYAPYTPGRSQVAMPTFRFGAAVANVTRRVGYFDDNDGVYFEQTSGGLRVVQRSGTVADVSVEQADWTYNGINDPFDGTGPSGITLDAADANILVIDMQALYVGRVRVGFDISGHVKYVHEFDNSNFRADPYIAIGSLPLRWEVRATAGSAGATMLAICGTVVSEGGESLYDMPGYTFSANNAITAVNVGTTLIPVLSIRNRTTLNSIANRAVAIPSGVDILNNGNAANLIQLVYNGTLTGASFGVVDTNNSTMEYDVAASAISGGITIASFYVASTATVKSAIGKDILGRALLSLAADGSTPDILSVCARALTGTNATLASIDWTEIR